MSTAPPLPVRSPPAASQRYTRTRNFGLVWPALALLLLLALNLLTPGFYHLEVHDGRVFGSLVDIPNRAAPDMIIAAGMTLVIATAGVDLSVGAIMALAGAVAAQLMVSNYSFPVAIAAALAAGLAAGIWNGVLVTVLNVQPIIATLILMVAGRGIAQMVTNDQHVRVELPAFTYVANGSFLGLPFPITLAVAVFLLTALLTRRTALGLFLQAVGNNPTASRYAGVPARTVTLFAYTLTGVLSALSGLIAASNIKEADVHHSGLYIELDAILAVVIGGTSLAGGRFSLAGSFIGALVIQTLTTSLLARDVAPDRTLVVKGAVVLAVCLFHSPPFRRMIAAPFRRGRTAA